MSADVQGQRPMCPVQNKVGYPSELIAATVGAYWNQAPYQCPECSLWHLRTQGRRAKHAGQKNRRFARRFKGGFHPHYGG